MCRGYFSAGRPRVDAFLLSPAFTEFNKVVFLLDTGADKTAITLRDALRLGADVPKITAGNPIEMKGVGGAARAYPIKHVELIFLERSPHSIDEVSVHIELLDEVLLIPNLPTSILGRDVLSRFDVEINSVSGEINLKRNDFGGGVHYSFLMKMS